MRENLEKILADRPDLWKGSGPGNANTGGIPTGYPALDAILPGGGWPSGAMVEIVSRHHGVGEVRILIPLMRRETTAGRWLFWICPPYLPYAPALQKAGIDTRRMLLIQNTISLEERLWSMERILQSHACGLLLAWPGKISNTHTRRLQLSASKTKTLGILFRSSQVSNSPTVLHLGLESRNNETHVTLLKTRGTLRRSAVTLPHLPY